MKRNIPRTLLIVFVATFVVSSAAAAQAAQTGTGITSTATLSPTSLTFPNHTVGTTSAAQFSTLTNSGATTITINSVTVSGDFDLAGLGTCRVRSRPGPVARSA